MSALHPLITFLQLIILSTFSSPSSSSTSIPPFFLPLAHLLPMSVVNQKRITLSLSPSRCCLAFDEPGGWRRPSRREGNSEAVRSLRQFQAALATRFSTPMLLTGLTSSRGGCFSLKIEIQQSSTSSAAAAVRRADPVPSPRAGWLAGWHNSQTEGGGVFFPDISTAARCTAPEQAACLRDQPRTSTPPDGASRMSKGSLGGGSGCVASGTVCVSAPGGCTDQRKAKQQDFTKKSARGDAPKKKPNPALQ
ncbi:hypothetical protein EYF80_015014 [Liparis tanakae]|uniref:Uncharacterized protein n=1 Tax=Liparis tanakae TaxID=230148 RepID=A0A4Z2I9J7_9TELE|nr:hypothetical protein EYF80_015014 [Liparis tanakae]